MKQLDVMIDLETLDTAPTAVILSITAVPFNINNGEIYVDDIYSESVDIDSSLKRGFTIKGSTFTWWLMQSKEAREIVCKGQEHAHDIEFIIDDFSIWYDSLKNKYGENIYIWGNGSDFDVATLRNAYNVILGYEPPFDFRKIQDLRTMVRLAPEIKENMKFEGIEHNPIYDCKHQIKYLTKIYSEKFLKI